AHSFSQTVANAPEGTRVISTSFNVVKGARSKVFQTCVGAGRANEGLRADWQQQLTVAKKEIGFKYIRFHGLLHDDMHVYTEDTSGKPIYNWQYVDKLYDFLLSIQVKPFVEFGFMPPALASGDKTVFWWKGNIMPPKSYDKWSALITALVKHWEERYGRKELEQWYFEVWNEPNLKEFFGGKMEDYFKLYEVTAKAVKGVSTSYRVGGPATSSSTWMKESLEYFSTIPNLVDFISTHAYGTRSVFDEFGKRRTQMREADGIPIPIRKLRSDVDASAMKGREIHITEWNSSPNPLDPLHDTYNNASYLLNVLKKTEHLVNSMSYWTFSDIFEEAGPPPTSFHGGFGLLTLQSIKKPSYYAYKFLNDLGSTELTNTDSSSWICKDAKGNVQALFWNYKLLSPDSSYNQQFYNKVIPAVNAGSVSLSINNMPNGKYKMIVYKTGYHNNDAFTAYKEMGAPFNISLQQEAALKKVADGSPETEKTVTITNGKLVQQFAIRENDVFFVTFIKQ
ncbi:MAG TPA: glycoside hydrolase, partial [Segetibacter sp.]